MAFHIVLVEPEIPSNTGNIARTCAGTGTSLHLVKPLGFSTDDKMLKRAGLDYWENVDIYYHESFEELAAGYPDARFFMSTTKAKQDYTQFRYQDGDFFVFGKETRGLPDALIQQYNDSTIRIPMSGSIRSLNLSNAAAIVLFEGLRQIGFPNLT